MANPIDASPDALLVKTSPYIDPAKLLAGLDKHAHVSFLDSASRSPQLGRFSYLAFDPFGVFETEEGVAFWNGSPLVDPPLIALQNKLDAYHITTIVPDLPPFQGGAIGYASYEAGRLLEKLPKTTRELERGPDLYFPFYDVVLAVDHFSDCNSAEQAPKAWIISTGLTEIGTGEATEETRRRRAQERLEWFETQLSIASEASQPNETPAPIRGWRSHMPRADYTTAIERTKTYIRDGDIFQANITQRFSAILPDQQSSSPLAYYLQLRANNAAPFAAYLDAGDHVIASSSPERFVILDAQKNVQTRPIKGTAPRFLNDQKKDQASARELIESEKDRAENVMITDLMRNDLSRVCEPGSIKVPDLCKLESYALVHHLVSTVEGKLKPQHGAVALLGASFPGGSITGAPKIRAMEIISEIEDLPRGVYCGSIGYIGFNGTMDTNIAIRTVTFKDGKAHFNVGGGITILSEPDAEYEECLHKASALFRAFGTSVKAERKTLTEGEHVEEASEL